IISRYAARENVVRPWFSKQIEILALLPFAYLEVETRDLGFLDGAVVVYERLAEGLAQSFVFAQAVQRFGQRARQDLGLGLVGRVGRRRQRQLARDAVQPGVDLGGEIEVRVGRRLAGAIFQPRSCVSRTTEDADER